MRLRDLIISFNGGEVISGLNEKKELLLFLN